jgi:hypothetical protein
MKPTKIRIKSNDNVFRTFYNHGYTKGKNIYICKHCKTYLVLFPKKLKIHKCIARLKEQKILIKKYHVNQYLKTCKSCDGKGGSYKRIKYRYCDCRQNIQKRWKKPNKKCKDCKGKGLIPVLQYFECSICEGSGYFLTDINETVKQYIKKEKIIYQKIIKHRRKEEPSYDTYSF